MIYSLRTFKQTGIQEDETIGRRFETVYKGLNKEEFDSLFENVLNDDFKQEVENIYAIIYSAQICIPLYKTHKYFIVTEHGNTYANVTFKDKVG